MKRVLSALAAVILGGCMQLTPPAATADGSAVRHLLAAQTRGAGARADLVDGRAAQHSQRRYEQSFADEGKPAASLMSGAAK